MSSTIDIYDSYRAGTTTYVGSFPFYNNYAAIACSVSAANIITNALTVTYDLDETFLLPHIIMEPGDQDVDPYTEIPLIVDISVSGVSGLITSYLLL